MTDSNPDTAAIVALLDRLTNQRLPRALSIKEKVDAGGTLDNYDLAFLNDVVRDSEHVKAVLDRHPELNEIVAKMIRLYHEITARALANEGGGDTAP